MKWECSRCGKCCAETLATTADGNVFGIYLEPAEVDRFPAVDVFPLLGRGDPVVVTAYQLGVNRCPNYKEEKNGSGRCGIYERRPLTCASFPVLGRTKVDVRCLGVKKLSPEGIDADSITSELAAHQEKLARMLERTPDEWIWPLNLKRWIPLPRA